MSYFEQFTTLDDLKLSSKDSFYTMKEKFNILKETLQNHNKIDNRINNNQLQLIDDSGLKLRFNNVDNISLPSNSVVWDYTYSNETTGYRGLDAYNYALSNGSYLNFIVSNNFIVNKNQISIYIDRIDESVVSQEVLYYQTYFDIRDSIETSDAKIYVSTNNDITFHIWIELYYTTISTSTTYKFLGYTTFNINTLTFYYPDNNWRTISINQSSEQLRYPAVNLNSIYFISRENNDIIKLSRYTLPSPTGTITLKTLTFDNNIMTLDTNSDSSIIISNDIVYTFCKYRNIISLISFSISLFDESSSVLEDYQIYEILETSTSFIIPKIVFNNIDTFNAILIDLNNNSIYNVIFNISSNSLVSELQLMFNDKSYQFNMILDDTIHDIKWKFNYIISDSIVYYFIYNSSDRMLVFEYTTTFKLLNKYFINTPLNSSNNSFIFSFGDFLIISNIFNNPIPGGDDLYTIKKLNLDNNIKFDLNLNSTSATESYNIINYNMRDSDITQSNISSYSGTNAQNYSSNRHMYKKSCSYFFKKNQLIKKDVYDNEETFNYSLTHHENNKL